MQPSTKVYSFETYRFGVLSTAQIPLKANYLTKIYN